MFLFTTQSEDTHMSTNSNVILPEETINEVRYLANNSHHGTVRTRAQAMLKLAGGATKTAVAKAFHTTTTRVSQWFENLVKNGVEGITNTSGRRKEAEKTSATQSAQEQWTVISPKADSQEATTEGKAEATEQIGKGCSAQGQKAETQGTSDNSEAAEHQESASDAKQDTGDLLSKMSELKADGSEIRAELEIDVRARMKIIDSKTGEAIEREIAFDRSVLNDMGTNFENPQSFAKSVTGFTNNLYAEADKVCRILTEKYIDSQASLYDQGEKNVYHREVEAFRGRYSVQIPKILNGQLGSTERIICTDTLDFMMWTSAYGKSFRFAADNINSSLRKFDDEKISYRTLQDMFCREGHRVNETNNAIATEILVKNGVDPETLSIIDDSKFPKNDKDPIFSKENEEVIKSNIVDIVTQSNNDEKNIHLDLEKCLDIPIYHENSSVMLSIDGVLSKKQKEHRKGCQEEDLNNYHREMINTRIFTITSEDGIYRFAAQTLHQGIKLAYAYMLDKKLLENRMLCIFTDGEKAIQTAISKVFSYRPYQVLLDWYHLKHYCYSLFTMALVGGKDNFQRNSEIRREFYKHLFFGDLEGAINYLKNIDKSFVKNQSKIVKIEEYLLRKKDLIYNYYLRKKLCLINSSNLCEKTNDLVIAQRTKNNGTSWSRYGVDGMGSMRLIYINRETEWFSDRK